MLLLNTFYYNIIINFILFYNKTQVFYLIFNKKKRGVNLIKIERLNEGNSAKASYTFTQIDKKTKVRLKNIFYA